MTTTFRLPDLGEGLTESEIVAWKVAEGDTVELNEVLAEVETAKAVVDLPSPYAGVIRTLHAGEGETVLVGAPLIDFDVEDDDDDEPTAEDVATTDAGAESAPEAAPNASPAESEDDETSLAAVAEHATSAAAAKAPEQAERVSVLVGSIKVAGGERPRRARRTFEATPFERAARPITGPAKAMPPVRALAKQRGIDLSTVQGTGEGGLVTRADIDRVALRGAQQPAVQQGGVQHGAARGSRRERVSGLRKHTAAAMSASAFTAPHAAAFVEVDVTETLELVRAMKAQARGEASPSFLALVSRAVILAAKRTPEVNATFDADAGEIETFDYVNLGVAVATDRGLVVASVDDADLLDATALTEQIADRAARARAGKLSQAELTSSTITVSNVGVFGVDGGIPILNPGEAAILAVGTVRRKPWEHQGAIALREVCTITCSFDHRLIDGKEASTFLADVAAVLERPALALAR